jgi:hypothetical protein
MAKKEKKIESKVNIEEISEEKIESNEVPEEGKKKINYSKQGKLNRAAGRRFEAKVRAELEALGWVIDKWTNTVDYQKWKLVPAKRKYNPFLKVLSIGNGFPDFVCIKHKEEKQTFNAFGEEIDAGKNNYEVIGLEVKRNGYLDQIEKSMCHWLLENKIFSKILIAKAKQEGRKTEVEYIDFKEKYKKDFPEQ